MDPAKEGTSREAKPEHSTDAGVSQSPTMMASPTATTLSTEAPQVLLQDEPETLSSSPTSTSPITTQAPQSPSATATKPTRSSTTTPPSSFTSPRHSGYRGDRTSEGQQSYASNAVSDRQGSPASTGERLHTNGIGSSSFSTSASTSSARSQRNSSFEYKETLNATMRHLEDGSRIINQYRLGKMIGQGAYGSVYHACRIDDSSQEFAIKEFGKTRLRKRNRAQNLRKPQAGWGRGQGGEGSEASTGQASVSRRIGQAIGDTGLQAVATGLKALNVINADDGDSQEQQQRLRQPQSPPPQSPQDAISLIRREVAILKKLHHPHLVRLYEVLDDPTMDGIFMVFEHCSDGTVIDVRLHEQVKPIDEPIARTYLIQIMLGIEYLHYHNIVHRDIKPDNILLKNGRKTCKIVDFGVSEFFVKPGDDRMHGSAGSPAFMSPELCTAGHGDLPGKMSDMWSFGVTFYCMVVGHLPFDKHQFLELYESIKTDEPDYPSHLSEDCKDLLQRMLAKQGSERITIAQMREHPFITKRGKEHVMSREENIKDVVDDVTPEEVASAIINIASVFTLARAISKFKRAGSRASSAGSLNELTSTILTKRKETLQSDISSTTNEGESVTGLPADTNDRSIGKGSDSAGSDDQPSLRHLAEAHVVAGSSNMEGAAEHIARGVLKITDKVQSKMPSSSAKKGQEGADDAGEMDGTNDVISSPSSSSSQPLEKRRREETGDATPQPSNTSPSRGPEIYSRDMFGNKVDTLQQSESEVDKGENGETSERMLNLPQPKLFPDQPTVNSPNPTDLPTPRGAADSYIGRR